MSLPKRFLDSIRHEPGPDNVDGPCWVWTGSRSRLGYGRYNHDGSGSWAYRYAYLAVVGPIPEGLELDHLCRRPACVNPAHLEPVTHAENMARGATASKTHCANGHPFDDANTHHYRRPNGNRDCRTCMRERVLRFYERRRQARRGAA